MELFKTFFAIKSKRDGELFERLLTKSDKYLSSVALFQKLLTEGASHSFLQPPNNACPVVLYNCHSCHFLSSDIVRVNRINLVKCFNLESKCPLQSYIYLLPELSFVPNFTAF